MTISKGGRIPQKSSNYFSMPSQRDANFRDVKRQFGSIGVDIYLCGLEQIAQSDFFLFQLSDKNLRRIQNEDLIEPGDFIKVIRYCTLELEVFDNVLFEQNYLFSVAFVRNFHHAGLFRHRTYGIDSILHAANSYRPGHPPLTLEDNLEQIVKGKINPNHQASLSGTSGISSSPKPTPNINDQDLPF